MKSKIIRIVTVPISFKHLLNGQISFIGKNGFNVTIISSDGKELKNVLKNENCNHFLIPLTREVTIFRDLFCIIKLFFFLRKEKPDIVHTHTPKAGFIGMVASYLARVPIRLHTVAGLPLVVKKGIFKIILNFVEKITYKCATKIYPNSFGLKKIILKNKFTHSDKIKVIGNGSSNGIDTSFFSLKNVSNKKKKSIREKFKILETDFVFIFVGRIVKDKGIKELVHAFSKLSQIKKNVKLLLVGPYENELDPLDNHTMELINTNNNIISVGYKNDVRPYFAISNVLVFPSYREGFPNVVMQSGSMGVPSIVSNINGCNEIIKNNENGIIVSVKNINAIYDALIKIYSDKLFFHKLKLNCRGIIKKKYERKNFWKLLLLEYKNLLKKNLN